LRRNVARRRGPELPGLREVRSPVQAREGSMSNRPICNGPGVGLLTGRNVTEPNVDVAQELLAFLRTLKADPDFGLRGRVEAEIEHWTVVTAGLEYVETGIVLRRLREVLDGK
jgi:hypothetical protein